MVFEILKKEMKEECKKSTLYCHSIVLDCSVSSKILTLNYFKSNMWNVVQSTCYPPIITQENRSKIQIAFLFHCFTKYEKRRKFYFVYNTHRMYTQYTLYRLRVYENCTALQCNNSDILLNHFSFLLKSCNNVISAK